MTIELVEEKLENLLGLIQQERQAALNLDMQELDRVVQCKQQLLDGFSPRAEDAAGLETLVRKVDDENRRNAFLLWSGLQWVRETMSFFGQNSSPEVYGNQANSKKLDRSGRLLSGRV